MSWFTARLVLVLLEVEMSLFFVLFADAGGVGGVKSSTLSVFFIQADNI